MPLVNIFLREGTTPAFRRDVSLSVHRAMVDVLGIPEDDRFHHLHEFRPENIQTEPVAFGIPRGDRTLVVQMFFNPRPPEVKEALFAAARDRLRDTAGVPEEDLFLCVVETARENWWAAGRVVDPATGYDARMDRTGASG
ncbi:tautomerase family protein [Streptomyces benahoarensis]|uniref:Tautomerase family protein n=1 Tax=Streptomyces benahoarensis TaxID=2595054 RepID=A0A553ZEK3_9ACTN|nr:tautomerase family protein [Streptomyces benahoarensis]TSB21252.1 tautomerase family protein [Streptomyces benahoarensis]TSB39883.1 tautomerase family protein [Streptomyces benahoarensis]